MTAHQSLNSGFEVGLLLQLGKFIDDISRRALAIESQKLDEPGRQAELGKLLVEVDYVESLLSRQLGPNVKSFLEKHPHLAVENLKAELTWLANNAKTEREVFSQVSVLSSRLFVRAADMARKPAEERPAELADVLTQSVLIDKEIRKRLGEHADAFLRRHPHLQLNQMHHDLKWHSQNPKAN